MASFWDNIGPGLLETGGNIFLQNRAAQEGEKRLRRAQGPLYDQQQAMAGQALNLARGMDPKAQAAERFAAQQALVAPGNEAELQALMRQLQAKGMTGVASFSPVAGTSNTTGQPMNPQMAALFAAQQGAKNQAAFQSLGEGERYLNTLLQRGGMLQQQAQGAQAAGIKARFGDKYTGLPAKPSASEMLIKGGMNILKDPKARDMVLSGVKKIPGMLGSAGDWISGLFGGDTRDYFGNSDFSFGF